jgi:hypothetical protein
VASTLASIVDAIRDAVKVDHTGSGGVYDLSGTDSVKIGSYPHPPTTALAFVAISGPTVRSAPTGVAIGSYGRTATFEIQCWAPATADDTETRVLAACDLLDDAFTAIEASMRVAGGALHAMSDVIDVVCEASALDGDALGLGPEYGFVSGTVVVTYTQTRGV